MANDKTPKRGQDNTGKQRIRDLRTRKERVEAYLDPSAYTEVETLIAAGEATDKADLVRQALHEKYLRWTKAEAVKGDSPSFDKRA